VKSLAELIREREPELEQLIRERDYLDARWYGALARVSNDEIQETLSAIRARDQIERLPR